MRKNRIGIILSIITIGTLMLGCSGSSSATPVTPTSGVVIDDYIKGAIVCADVNGNGKADDGNENCVLTDNQGRFNFGEVRDEHLVMSGGTDIGTNKPFTGTFLAPPHSKVINPLTTIVRSVQTEGNVTLTQAQEIVKAKLNLPDVDLTEFDPLAEVQFNSDITVQENAQQVLAQQSSIQVILTTVATTIASTSDNVKESEVMEHAADQIAKIMLAANTANTDVDIDSKENIEEVITQTTEKTLTKSVEAGTLTQEEADTAKDKVDVVKTVVSQQVETASVTVVANVEAITVNNEESGVEAIKEANAAILLVTDKDSADSVANIIEESVTTGDTTTLADVNITTQIDDAQTVLINRPDVVAPDDTPVEVIPTTGAEGGN